MRIAFITLEYPPYLQGGAGIYARDMTRQLARLGHDVHVITPNTRTVMLHLEENGLFIHRIPLLDKPLFRALSFWLALPACFGKIEKEFGDFDVIHGNGVGDFSLSKRVTSSPRISTIHHLASRIVDILRPSLLERFRGLSSEIGLTPFLEGVCIQRSDRIIAVSESTRKDILARFRIPSDRISVIYNGVSQRECEIAPAEQRRIRGKFVENDEKMVLCVGRLEKRKGLDDLIRAFRIVLRDCRAKLFLVGKGDQSSYRELAKALGISENVVFMGYVSDLWLARFYSVCDVFVLPSLLEGFGLVLLEAVLAGKPVVATRVGIIPELMRSPGNGCVLVKSKDERDLAKGIVKCLQNEEYMKKEAERNSKWVTERFDWKRNAEQVTDVYREIVL